MRNTALMSKASKRSKIKRAVTIFGSCMSASILATQMVMGEDIFDRFATLANTVYMRILAISTIVAVCVCAVALLIRMFSHNQKSVDDATAWIKRIAISYVILNTLGLIVAFFAPLVANGSYSYTPTS